MKIITAVTAFLLLISSRTEAVAIEIERQPLIRHNVELNGHPFAIYEKRADASAEIIVLIHGKTISALPNFDLQHDSKNISLMDAFVAKVFTICLLYTSPSPRDRQKSRMPSSA